MKKKNKTISPPIYVQVTNCERLNIRESPIATSEVVRIVNKGTVLITSSFDPDRVEVRFMDGSDLVGYALKDYLKVISDREAEEAMR